MLLLAWVYKVGCCLIFNWSLWAICRGVGPLFSPLWSTFFGLIASKFSIPDLFLPKVFGQVEAIHSHLVRSLPSFIDASVEVPVQWLPPPPGVFKLNTNGSSRNGLAACACGALIHDSHGRFVRAFIAIWVQHLLFVQSCGGSRLGFV